MANEELATGQQASESFVDFVSTRPEPEEPGPAPEEETAEATEVEEGQEAQPDADVDDDEPQAEPEEAEAEPEEHDEAEPVFSWETRKGTKYMDVTLQELQDGYMRQEDHSRAHGEIQRERQELEGQIAENKQLREQLQASLTEWVVTHSEPDWVQLAQTLSPQEYQLAQARHAQKSQGVQQAEQQLQAMKAEDMQAEKAKLLEVFPTWSDPDQLRADMTKMTAFAAGHGFTEAELMAVEDSRLIRILKVATDATAELEKVREAKATAAKKVANVPKALTPGMTPTKGDDAKAKAQKARERLRAKQGADGSFVDWILT